MSAVHTFSAAIASCTVLLFAATPATAGDQWAGETFLSDYSQLKLVEGREGRDYVYVAPESKQWIGKYRSVLLDQPEVFIASDSPYRGAKPDDLAAIAGMLRSTAAGALQQRGYRIVDQPAADAVYVRIAVTDLQIEKKKRNLLAYTPVGFVVDAGVKALEGFMDKYDILDVSLQLEIQDSLTQEVLGAAVIQRGKSADSPKRISFELLVAAMNEYSDRLACRLDNSHVQESQRVNCLDPVARKARPLVVGP